MAQYAHIVADFIDRYAARGITLDGFQIEAIEALAAHSDVLVSAPTGAGKTVVAEFAVDLALARSKRCIYTAPIKALSNQKYKDLVSVHGADNLGLLTGDVTINREAPIVVVTTEVLRNMTLHRDDSLIDVGYAVLDEVHYLADPFRGPVWEEIILTLPSHVRLVSLSATIANIDEFSGWLRSVRGRTTTVFTDFRPVPLEQLVMRGKKLLPLYKDGETNPALLNGSPSQPGSPAGMRLRTIELLGARDMLPAIEFIFSRKGCDRAVGDLLDAGIYLTTREQAREVRKRLDVIRADLSAEDARAIKFGFWSKAFCRGFGAHHAGMFPALKELAEELMDAGLLKLVYATGTLALGIDMPVRTVVVESLRKFNGQDFVDLSATEYIQLIGRAGRRGKDTVGYAVIMDSADLDVAELADIGSGKVEPLESVFFPSYNTVVNLLDSYSYADARAVMGTSFAQYQRNADLGQIEARALRIRERLRKVEAELADTCGRGDVVDYLRLREQAGRASKAERKRAKEAYREKVADSWHAVRTGKLYAYARDGHLEYGVALSIAARKIRFVSIFGELVWLYRDELSAELREVGEIPMPFGVSLKSPQVREDIALAMIDEIEERSELGVDLDLEASWDRFAVRSSPELERHSVHLCPDVAEHIDDGAELLSLDKRLADLEALRASYDDSVARDFDATANVLRVLGYIQGEDLGSAAMTLQSIHNEADLLIVESLKEASVKALSAAEFAGLISGFLGDRRLGTPLPRRGSLRAAWDAVERNHAYLVGLESDHGITRTPECMPGSCDAFTAWAEGANLSTVLGMSRLVVGDFISANRRLIDVLGQLADSDPSSWVAKKAFEARDLVRKWAWL